MLKTKSYPYVDLEQITAIVAPYLDTQSPITETLAQGYAVAPTIEHDNEIITLMRLDYVDALRQSLPAEVGNRILDLPIYII